MLMCGHLIYFHNRIKHVIYIFITYRQYLLPKEPTSTARVDEQSVYRGWHFCFSPLFFPTCCLSVSAQSFSTVWLLIFPVSFATVNSMADVLSDLCLLVHRFPCEQCDVQCDRHAVLRQGRPHQVQRLRCRLHQIENSLW